jgi:hypothetical protein
MGDEAVKGGPEMATYTIDTHETVRQFVAAGMPDKQAEAIVEAISRVDSEVVTKADLKQEVAAVKADLKQEIAAVKADLKQEIAAVKADLKQEIAAVKADLKQEIAAVKADLDVLRSDMKAEISTAINKMMLAQIAIAGLLFAALKLF